jgi:hypothetical protein
MSFDIIFCKFSCMPTVLCKQNWNSSFLNYWHTTLHTFTQNATHNKQKCCMKKYGCCPMHHGTKMCKFKKIKSNGEHLWAFNFNKGGGTNSLSKPYFYYITNLLCFISSYKFHAKSNFHRFLQKSHEFYVMVNMNDIYTYSIFKIFKYMRFFLKMTYMNVYV